MNQEILQNCWKKCGRWEKMGSHVIQTTGIKAETTKRVSGKNGFK